MSVPVPSAKLPSVTFVTCIESGVLESEVPLMVESLRRFGGQFAQCPVIAVSPRWVGLPLRSQTRKELDKLGIQLVEKNVSHRYNWLGFINKPTALVLAAPHIKTDFGLWLDGDILVARPPDALAENLDIDIMAAVEEMGPVSTGPENKFDSFWARLAETNGLKVDDLPWVVRPFSRTKIRIYFNSGVFRYRTGINFETNYLKAMEEVLDARIVPKDDPSIFLHEQISFALSVPRYKLSFKELADTYNFHVEDVYEECCPVSRYEEVSLFHYHRALRGPYRPKFIDQLRPHFPDLAELVASHVMYSPTGIAKYRNIPRRLLYDHRAKKMRDFTKECTRV